LARSTLVALDLNGAEHAASVEGSE
jgi:hypothetical protein